MTNNKHKNIIFAVVLFLLLFNLTTNGDDFQKIGTTGFVFLELPVTARFMAMGETGIALTPSATEGLFINPALIALSEHKMAFNMTYSQWYVETTHQAAGFIYRIPAIGTVGIQAIYFDFGEILKTRNPTINDFGSYVELGTYSANAFSVGFSFARMLTEKFAFGATVKYVRENIDQYYAGNVITDLGFVYDTGFRGLKIGTFLQNFGLESEYVDEKFRMPQQLKMGIAADILGNKNSFLKIMVTAEAVHPSDAQERIHIGNELIIGNILHLRSGYKFGYEEENWTAGGGINFVYVEKEFKLDFAYMEHQNLESTLRYTLSMEL